MLKVLVIRNGMFQSNNILKQLDMRVKNLKEDNLNLLLISTLFINIWEYQQLEFQSLSFHFYDSCLIVEPLKTQN